MSELKKCKTCGGDLTPINEIGEHYTWTDCVKSLQSRLSAVTAERDKARVFQPMSTFEPKADKLQEYLVLYGDAEIDIATFQNTENPEEQLWYVRYEINDIQPYGWMELPEPIVKESTNGYRQNILEA